MDNNINDMGTLEMVLLLQSQLNNVFSEILIIGPITVESVGE